MGMIPMRSRALKVAMRVLTWRVRMEEKEAAKCEEGVGQDTYACRI
jgi:hypothetical protein